MKLFTVISTNRRSGKDSAPRYDLAPMNHAAACNFMDACRNESTDYRLHEWPEDVPHPAPPMYAVGYRRDKSVIPFAEALEARDALDARATEASLTLLPSFRSDDRLPVSPKPLNP